ncbi:DoxX family protein [Sphingorhabdus sp.]|uniref:DoxX family protein n=1 Tax=Sphingorhabdus sp. TaxID=1902408 RepID=UPI003982E448
MKFVTTSYNRAVALVSNSWMDQVTLIMVRVSLAGIFWRSGRTKVAEGSWLLVSDTAKFLFQEEYKAVPLPPEFAAYMATYAEHLFPILIILGLFTRLSALALLGMTMVIQIFVYPEAWWSVHIIWVSLALVLIVRGAGRFSIDTLLVKKT